VVHRARRVGASAVSRARLLLALAFAASGCGRSCAGSDATREVLRREGAGWRLVVTCTTRTSVGLDRREGPLLRGCAASGSATLETGAMSRSSALAGCSRASRDCGEVRRYCAALRAEVAEREGASGRIVGVAAASARDAMLFGVTPEGAIVRYPADHAAGPLREAVARALDPESLAMALARAGRLSRAYVGWAEEVAPLFTGPFVRRHLGELVEVARRCALRAVLVERVLREGGEAAFAPLFHRALREPESPRCGELIDALTRTHGDRVLPRDVR